MNAETWHTHLLQILLVIELLRSDREPSDFRGLFLFALRTTNLAPYIVSSYGRRNLDKPGDRMNNTGKPPFRGVTLPGGGTVVVLVLVGSLLFFLWIEPLYRSGKSAGPSQPTGFVIQDESLHFPDKADVPKFLAILADGDLDARRQSLLQLSSIGPDAAHVTAEIREQLRHPHPGIRLAALIAIRRVCQDLDVVIPVAIEMLDDEDSSIGEEAASTLDMSGPAAIEPVMKVIESGSPARGRAVLTLRRLMRPENFSSIRQTIDGLRDDRDLAVRAEALMFGLETGLTSAPALSALLEADYSSPAVHVSSNSLFFFEEEHRNSSELAVRAVIRLGQDASDVVPALISAFEKHAEREMMFNYKPSHQEPTRVPSGMLTPRMESVLEAFSVLRTTASAAIPNLTARLETAEPRIRPKIIAVLFDIGADPQALTPKLLQLIESSDHGLAWYAARELVRVNPEEARRQVAVLIAKWTGADLTARARIGLLLQGLGPQAQEAVPRLLSLLTDADGKHSYAADEALGSIGPAAFPAVPALVNYIQQTRKDGTMPPHGQTSIATLGKIGPGAKNALPLLLDIAQDPQLHQEWFRTLVMSALVQIAPDSAEVISAIRAQMESHSPRIRAAAVYHLAQFPNVRPHVLTDIIRVLETDPEGSVRAHAALAIAEMSGDRAPTLAPLMRALGDENPDIRISAAIALGSMGGAAKRALPTLYDMWIDALCGNFKTPPPNALPRNVTTVGLGSFAVSHRQRDLSMSRALLHAMMDIDPNAVVMTRP